MEIKELEVIRTDKGFGNQKPAYIVQYDGKEQRITLFDFQKGKEPPKTVKCVIDNNRLYQDPQVLLDEFYEEGESYLFRIKERRNKYYELEDDRIKGDNWILYLQFSNSRTDLVKGKVIKCRVTEITNKKPHLVLEDANPSLVDFIDKNSVFGEDRAFLVWLDSIFEDDHFKAAARLYDNRDGRWICIISKDIEKIIYSLLLSSRENKEHLLTTLCLGWLNAIEHSSFMAKITGKEKEEYSNWLAHSIEVCEDFRDALSLPDKKGKVTEIIQTLNPNYYQYRPERRLRFLSCLFSLNPELLRNNVDILLEQIGNIGEDESAAEQKYLSIKSLLLMSIHITTNKWMNRFSIPHEDMKDIKHGILALCFLIKIMQRRNEENVTAYISKVYLLISLCMNDQKEKLQALKNAYSCLFSDIHTIFQFKWEMFRNIIRSGLYLLNRDNVQTNTEISLIYDNQTSCCKLSAKKLQLSPCNYQGEWNNFNMQNGLKARICYGKSLSKLDTEKDFLSVRTAWKEVSDIYVSPIKKIERRKPELTDEEEVDIYITAILDNKESAYCKAVGYEEEGTILFKDLFFYKKPNLSIEDFTGSDGTPLVFPATCRISGESINFFPEPYKIDYARDKLKEETEVECSVISENKNSNKHSYVCVTSQGFFLYLNTDDRVLERGALVKATITQRNHKGNAQADLKEIIYENGHFYGKEAYITYLRDFNRYCYNNEMTQKIMEEEEYVQSASNCSSSIQRATVGKIQSVVHILIRLSELEKNPQKRYGYLAIGKMLSSLIRDKESAKLLGLRKKFTEILYNFSLNNRLSESDITDFTEAIKEGDFAPSATDEMQNILSILSKFKNRTKNKELDKTLIFYLESSSPIEKELARLVLSGNLLSNFQNPELQDKVLDEIGKVIHLNIFKAAKVYIGREGLTLEFKTSLVFPPNNGGNEDLEQQSENILRVILAMMNSKGGVLYIGVNDEGNVVGLYDDLHYFADSKVAYNETKAKDNFENHFSCLLANNIGAENASKFKYGFENKGDYDIFKVEIPVQHIDENNLFRVGNTVQEEK